MIVAAFGLTVPSGNAYAQNCVDDLTADSGAAALIACLTDLRATIRTLQDAPQQPNAAEIATELMRNHAEELRGAEGKPGKAGTDAFLPLGAVVAFDRPNGCPSGWVNMGGPWRGRSIVGATSDANSPYGFGKMGGAETHQLSTSEMPRHSHAVPFVPEVSNLSGGSYPVMSDLRHGSSARGNAPTTTAGAGAPHNNMPPYIALYLCKKEAE